MSRPSSSSGPIHPPASRSLRTSSNSSSRPVSPQTIPVARLHPLNQKTRQAFERFHNDLDNTAWSKFEVSKQHISPIGKSRPPLTLQGKKNLVPALGAMNTEQDYFFDIRLNGEYDPTLGWIIGEGRKKAASLLIAQDKMRRPKSAPLLAVRPKLKLNIGSSSSQSMLGALLQFHWVTGVLMLVGLRNKNTIRCDFLKAKESFRLGCNHRIVLYSDLVLFSYKEYQFKLEFYESAFKGQKLLRDRIASIWLKRGFATLLLTFQP